MDNQKIHHCFTFSNDQLKHLRSKKYKIDRMECFMSLVDLAESVSKLVRISKTKQVEIMAGQVMVDNTQLAKLWDKNRKTVPKLLEAMEKIGIFSSQKVEDNRIYTLHCLSGWYVDGKFFQNVFALKRNQENTAIIHADVPVAKVITNEDPDDKKKVKDIFLNEAMACAENTAMAVNDVANTGMLLFGGYIEAATHYVESHGGGGSSPSSDWGKKDDEDDWKFVSYD